MLKSRHGDDVEDIEVVFAAEGLFVPAHRRLERLHRPGAAVLLARARHRCRDRPCGPTPWRSGRDGGKIAGDEREEIGGLGEGIVPHGEVASVHRDRRARTGLPLDSRTGKPSFGASMRTREARHHVGPVEEVGDAAEALGLALRAVDAVRHVEARQRGIGLRIADGHDLEKEGLLRHADDGERARRDHIGVCSERHAIQQDGGQRDVLAVEDQRRARLGAGGVGADGEPAAHPRGHGIEGNLQIDRIDAIRRRAIIRELHRLGRGGCHDAICPDEFWRIDTMSRAFVKEQDDAPEHLTERPVSASPNVVTARGLRLIDGEIEVLRRFAGARHRHDADKAAIARASRDLRYWMQRRATAQVFTPPDMPAQVGFGTAATILREDGRRQRLAIVGEDEARSGRGAHRLYLAHGAGAARPGGGRTGRDPRRRSRDRRC